MAPRAGIACAALAATSVLLTPPFARASFELRDTRPEALGAASLDGAADLLFAEGPSGSARSGFFLGASRASLFEVEGLTMSQLVVIADRPALGFGAAWSVLEAPGAQESIARIRVEERARPAISLSGTLERLDTWVEGEPRWGGWALGGCARAGFPVGVARLRAGIEGDRLVRSAALDRARVGPSLAMGMALGVGGSTVAFLDRWEPRGDHGPRWIVELPLAEVALVRFARGAGPGRIGASLSVRVGRLTVSVGRLDHASGGSTSGAMVGFGSETTTRGPLLAPRPSATMRSDGWIARAARVSASADSAGPPEGVVADSPRGPGPGAGPQAPEWLPEAADVADIPDTLEAAAPATHGLLLRGGVLAGGFRIRRVAMTRGRPGARGEVSFLQARERWLPALVFEASDGVCRGAAGSISVGGLAPLFGEAMGLAYQSRYVRQPGWGVLAPGPALGESPAAIDGAAVVIGGRAGSASRLPGSWALAGRKTDDGRALGAAGIAWQGRDAAIAAAFGSPPRARGRSGRATGVRAFVASVTAMRRGSETEVSGEALASDGAWAALIAAERRRGPIRLSGRWRYRSWTQRRVAAELSAGAGGSGARARMTWRSWASGAAWDDGRIEIDAAATHGGLGPLRIRLGAEGLGKDPSHLWSGARYAIADWTVARDGARSLAILASRREAMRRTPPPAGAGAAAVGSDSTVARAAGATFGARLGLDAGGGGEHAIVLEATRISRGGPGAAWGSGVYPSGAAVLRTRSRPGVWITARGTFGRNGLRLGYALSRAEDGAGGTPLSGTVWIWIGSETPRAGSAGGSSDP